MARKTVREPAVNVTRRDSGPAPTVREGHEPVDPRNVVFPAALAMLYDPEESLIVGGEADCYRLRDKSSGQIVFGKVYRQGNSPNTAVLEALNAAAADKVVRLINSAPAMATSRAWEVTEFMHHGSLAELIAREGGKLPPSRVREILVEIVDALQHVHSLDVEHKDLKPANILVRSLDPLDLVLTDFGISSTMAETVRQTHRHRTVEYAPPEAASGTVYRNKWDCWSLGMVLVELLTGTHPFARVARSDGGGQGQSIEYTLAVGDVDDFVKGVEGKDWIRLCRGLLRRKPEARWGAEWVVRWLENPDDPSLVVAEEGPIRTARPFPVRGIDYHSCEALAACLRADRELLSRIWREKGQALMQWIEDDLGLVARARQLAKILKEDESLDCQLMRVLHALDPSLPPHFMARDITSALLVELADSLSPADQEGCHWIVLLHTEDVLAKAIPLSPEGEALDRALTSWRDSVVSYERARSAISSSSQGRVSPTSLSGEALASLLAAATPGSSALKALRRRAAETTSAAARSSLWFQSLGDARSAGPAEALLMIATASVADAEVKSSEAARESRNNQLWVAMLTGAGVGTAIGGGWWWATNQWCKAGDNNCISSGWFSQQVGTFDLLFVAAALTSAIAVLVSVHQQTGSRRF